MTALVVHGLFQKRIDGDDALLRLARRRFDEAGMSAEVYAGSRQELAWVLRFAPPGLEPPLVHLPRDIDLRDPRHRDRVAGIARGAAGRVRGFVVHDQRGMPDLPEVLADAAAALSPVLGETGTLLFLEYAARCSPEQFAQMAGVLAPFPGLGVCVDAGHVGVWAARRAFARRRPDLGYDLSELTAADPRLPEVVDDVVAAAATALPTVVDLTAELVRVGLPLHFHLHDGHPVNPGLPDHRGFLTRIPVPFPHDGRYSLDPLFGPAGLDALVAAVRSARAHGDASLTLEIHQWEGRLPIPLPEATELFSQWHDLANAERMNAWLAELSRTAMLVEAA